MQKVGDIYIVSKYIKNAGIEGKRKHFNNRLRSLIDLLEVVKFMKCFQNYFKRRKKKKERRIIKHKCW